MIDCTCERCGKAYRAHNSDKTTWRSRWCSTNCQHKAYIDNGGRAPKKPGRRQTFGHSASARMPDYVNGRPLANFDGVQMNRDSRRVFDEWDNIVRTEMQQAS